MATAARIPESVERKVEPAERVSDCLEVVDHLTVRDRALQPGDRVGRVAPATSATIPSHASMWARCAVAARLVTPESRLETGRSGFSEQSVLAPRRHAALASFRIRRARSTTSPRTRRLATTNASRALSNSPSTSRTSPRASAATMIASGRRASTWSRRRRPGRTTPPRRRSRTPCARRSPQSSRTGAPSPSHRPRRSGA